MKSYQPDPLTKHQEFEGNLFFVGSRSFQYPLVYKSLKDSKYLLQDNPSTINLQQR